MGQGRGTLSAMPITWHRYEEAPTTIGASSHAAGDAPYASARLWPHRSLPLKGFAMLIGFTFCMILIPTIPLLGTPVFWGLLPFLMGTVALLYILIMRNYRDGELVEELTIWSDRMAIVRREPDGAAQTWEANPQWVRLFLHEDKGPVKSYLTLRGGNREVELGAFLAPEERETLYDDLDRMLKRLPR